MFPTPRDKKYGAEGGGRDDGQALQKWLDENAGKPVFVDARYRSARPLDVHPGTTFHAHSRHIAGFHAHEALPTDTDTQLLRIQHGGGVSFHNIDITGSPTHREGAGAAIIIQNSDDVTFTGCSFSWFHHLVTPAATKRLRFHSCDFGHYSSSVPLPERESPEGRAIIAANAALPVAERKPEGQLLLRGNCQFNGGYALLGGNGAHPNSDVEIVGCDVHDGLWTAIDCLGPHNIHWQILDTRITDVHECGIYCGVTAIIDRVTIVGVRRRDCSGHCFEGGGIGTRITRCTFGRADRAMIFFTNPRAMYVADNTFFDAMEELEPNSSMTPWSAALFARNSGPVPPEYLADGLLIEDNDFHNTKGKATHLMFMYDDGAGPLDNITVRGNRMRGRWGPLLIADEKARGKNFVFEEAMA